MEHVHQRFQVGCHFRAQTGRRIERVLANLQIDHVQTILGTIHTRLLDLPTEELQVFGIKLEQDCDPKTWKQIVSVGTTSSGIVEDRCTRIFCGSSSTILHMSHSRITFFSHIFAPHYFVTSTTCACVGQVAPKTYVREVTFSPIVFSHGSGARLRRATARGMRHHETER